MSKAFTKETDDDDELPEVADTLKPGEKNYVTPAGHTRIVAELKHLRGIERPKIVEVVSWAAGNGDRSENGDYIYGKKKLREIDVPSLDLPAFERDVIRDVLRYI